MEKSRRRTLIALPLAVLLAAAGCTRKDPSPMAPDNAAEGERMMRQMSELLAKTPAFRFTTSETLEPAGGPAGGRILRFTRTVTVRRPSAMFFELDGTGDTAADVSAFYDGKAVSLRNNADGHWAQTPVPATLDGMLDDVAKRVPLPVPIADVVYGTPYDAFIGKTSVGGLAGREAIDGVECARLIYSDDLLDVHIWLPLTGQPLPRRVEFVYKYVTGAPRARIDFASWDLAPRIDDAMFTFTPGSATSQLAFEQFVGGLLSATPAAAAGGPAPAGAVAPR